MTTAQVVVETSVTVSNNSPVQNYVHPDDQTQPTFDISSWCVQDFRILKDKIQKISDHKKIYPMFSLDTESDNTGYRTSPKLLPWSPYM